MQIDTVSRLPFVMRSDSQVRVEEMGVERAQARAEALLNFSTVCTEPLPESVATVLQQAREALRAGDKSGALEIIRALLPQTHSGTRPPGAMRLHVQSDPDWRARIGATIQFAEELASQGDLAAYDDLMQDVGAYFDQQATDALKQAGFDESLRISEDALLLGREQVFELAKQRVQAAARQEVEEAIKDFDPCLPNPDFLENSIKDLLNALYKAQFFGAVDGTGLEEQATSLVEQGINNLDSLVRGEQPTCSLSGMFSIAGATGFAHLTGTLRSCQGMRGPWQGTLQLQYNDGDGFGSCSGSAEWSFMLPGSEADGEIAVPLACSAPGDCYYTSASELLRFHVVREQDGLRLTIGSTGGGGFIMVCPEPDAEDFTTSGPLALFWGTESDLTVEVPLTSEAVCP